VKRFITLPFVNKKADEFGKRLTKLVNSNFPLVDLRVAFVAPLEIGKLFKFKDSVNDLKKQSLVVYQIKCSNCEASYIGKTARILHLRIEEHRKSPSSCLFQHQLETNHTIDFDGTRVLDRADTDRKLQVKEVLYIDKLKPSLNTQLNSQAQFRIATNIFGSKKILT
jgi:hypothetical protein